MNDPHNVLVLGKRPLPILKHLPDRFLMIDDGEIIDRLTFDDAPEHFSIERFDPLTHRINPLKDIDHRRARELASVLYAADPGGDSTLTVRNGKRTLARLLKDANRLDRITGNRKDPAIAEALGVIDNVLFSPLVKDMLCDGTNLSFKGTVLARLNPAELGDEDCLIFGLLLMLMYPGPVVVTDFGFYGRKHHLRLIRQNRLIAGLRSLSQVGDELRSELLLIDTKIPSRCTYSDAEELAPYEGLIRGTEGYSSYVQRAIA